MGISFLLGDYFLVYIKKKDVKNVTVWLKKLTLILEAIKWKYEINIPPKRNVVFFRFFNLCFESRILYLCRRFFMKIVASSVAPPHPRIASNPAVPPPPNTPEPVNCILLNCPFNN